MPRRNPLGSILEKQITKKGKKIKVYDVRKRYRDEHGIYKDKTKRCYSYSEALAVLSNMPAVIADDRADALAGRHSFFELIEYYRERYCKAAVFVGDQQIAGFRQSPRAIGKYLDDFKAFFGNPPAASITYEDVRRFAEHLAITPVEHANARKPVNRLPKPATVNRKLSYLRRVFNVGKQLRWISVNPFSEGSPLIRVQLENARERVLEYDEEARLLAACEDGDVIEYQRGNKKVSYSTDNARTHLRLVLILAIDTGLRKKEIFSLERKDIVLEENIILVPAPRTKALKRRVVVISPRLEKELRKYFEIFSFHPNAPIFFGRVDADRAFATACRRAGIEGLKFHDLRHTATTWMDEAGVSQAVKQNMIGHASDRVHQRYHNLSSDIVRSVREKMDEHRRTRKVKLSP